MKNKTRETVETLLRMGFRALPSGEIINTIDPDKKIIRKGNFSVKLPNGKCMRRCYFVGYFLWGEKVWNPAYMVDVIDPNQPLSFKNLKLQHKHKRTYSIETARLIRKTYAEENITQQELKERFKVSVSHISSILNNRYFPDEAAWPEGVTPELIKKR